MADGAVALMHKLATGSARATDFTGPFKYTICGLVSTYCLECLDE